MESLRHRLMLYGLPLVCLLGLAAAWTAWRLPRSEQAPPPPELTVFGDAALRLPLQEAVDMFERRYGIRVATVYAETNHTLERMEQAGQGDVWVTDHPASIREALARGLLGEPALRLDRTAPAQGSRPLYAALLSASAHREEARTLLTFLSGPAAQGVFRKYRAVAAGGS